jgi:hypothetical protein
MSESLLKNQLLQQNGAVPVEAELNVLRKLVENEQRRARRLVRWTIGVWAVWIVMLALMFAFYILSYSPNANGSSATTMPIHGHQGAAGKEMVLAAIMVAVVVGVLLLPVAGIIVLILSVLARRSAGSMQIRASLASIDARLRMLGGHQKSPGI